VIAQPVVAELSERCRFLLRVGLDYLSLDRSGPTLSGGEAQRVRLAAQLAAQLSGVLYVLDEPTIGLHPHDNNRLLDALDQLRTRGNTVVVVEHDRATIDRADVVLDMGPGGGSHGGHIVTMGTPASIRECAESLTGQWLEFPQSPQRVDRPLPTGFIELTRARLHNLNDLDIQIPKGRMTVVTGVSGSGKTTLVRGVLQPRLRAAIAGDGSEGIAGYADLRRLIEVDQSPIGRTPRSVPATYVGIMDKIRQLFAKLPEAQIRGFKPGRFSFNVKAGRCETCSGQGAINVSMAFLPDAFVPCEVCGGKRYNSETLRVTYRGRSIADVLTSTVEEAMELFEAHAQIFGALELMNDLGLGYLTLGQASNTLSGGEAQRIKLVAELRKRSSADTVYVLDEPSTGLHMADLARLLKVLQRFVERGDTVVVIEHNLDVIACADWIVDLGPGGGDNGGQLVYQGPLQAFCETKSSHGHTATYLAEHLHYVKNATCAYNHR
jgi:excinuclease ABC subunit A